MLNILPRPIVLLPVLSALSLPAGAQGTFRTRTDLVTLTVTVTDGDGDDLVTGLTAREFRVYENGVEQQIQFFETELVPLDIILLLDSSASMRLEMPTVQKAAHDFMRLLRPGDRGALATFTEQVHVVQDLTADRAAIQAAIDSVTADGSTALHNALYVSLKVFGRRVVGSDAVRRQALVVLSDGADSMSLVAFDDVLALARSLGISVYTIGLNFGSSPLRAATYALDSLARETGARSFFPPNVYALRNVYKQIARELRAQYSLAYAPRAAGGDRQIRRVRVSVPTRPQLQARTRTGYVMPRQ